LTFYPKFRKNEDGGEPNSKTPNCSQGLKNILLRRER